MLFIGIFGKHGHKNKEKYLTNEPLVQLSWFFTIGLIQIASNLKHFSNLTYNTIFELLDPLWEGGGVNICLDFPPK